MERVEAIVIGAGVVGLAIAAKLSRRLSSVLVIDKNLTFGEETSSRNSEVIHAGIYYPKNSLKAQLCVAGKQALYQYCLQRHIAHQAVGKILVAHNADEEQKLAGIIETAQGNGVEDLSWLSLKQLQKMEPALSARAAVFSPSTGIIDVHHYMQSLLAELESNGGLFVADSQMINAEVKNDGFAVTINSGKQLTTLACNYLVNSAGLFSTEVANNIEGMPGDVIPTIHYCRGHYFSYSGTSPFKHLIYPLPEANGLGIHASLDVGGQLKFGPDTQYINQLQYDVPIALKAKFVQSVRRYFPSLDEQRLQPDYSGIRPKLQAEGQPFADFNIQGYGDHKINGLVNLFGIDSPGLTSSLAVADHVNQLLLGADK